MAAEREGLGERLDHAATVRDDLSEMASGWLVRPSSVEFKCESLRAFDSLREAVGGAIEALAVPGDQVIDILIGDVEGVEVLAYSPPRGRTQEDVAAIVARMKTRPPGVPR